jgi:hypothetical protein
MEDLLTDDWKADLMENVWVERDNVLVMDPETREAEIRRLAYRLWEQAGSPPGDGVEFWVSAERAVDEAIFG